LKSASGDSSSFDSGILVPSALFPETDRQQWFIILIGEDSLPDNQPPDLFGKA
jgi:hypothetical protein